MVFMGINPVEQILGFRGIGPSIPKSKTGPRQPEKPHPKVPGIVWLIRSDSRGRSPDAFESYLGDRRKVRRLRGFRKLD